MKLLLTLIAGLALSTSAIAAGGGCEGGYGDCDGKKDKKGKEAASISFII